MTTADITPEIFAWMALGAALAGIGFGALGLYLYERRRNEKSVPEFDRRRAR